MQGVHRPPFLLPPHPHLSFLLGPSSVAHKFQSWRLTLTIHTQPTQPIVVHTEKQFKQKKWLLLWLQHHREQKLTQKTLLPTTLFLYGIEVCLSALLSQQWPMSPSGAARSAVPMHRLMEHSFWLMLMLHLSCCHAHQDGQAKTDPFSLLLCCPVDVAGTPQGMVHPVSALCLPCPQGAAQWPGLGLLPPSPDCPAPDQGRWMGPAMSCPSTPRSRDRSWIPALIVPQCFSQANHHWLPLPTSLQCHSKLIFIPVPFVLSSTHLHNILLGFFLFLLPITIPFSPLFP